MSIYSPCSSNRCGKQYNSTKATNVFKLSFDDNDCPIVRWKVQWRKTYLALTEIYTNPGDIRLFVCVYYNWIQDFIFSCVFGCFSVDFWLIHLLRVIISLLNIWIKKTMFKNGKIEEEFLNYYETFINFYVSYVCLFIVNI